MSGSIPERILIYFMVSRMLERINPAWQPYKRVSGNARVLLSGDDFTAGFPGKIVLQPSSGLAKSTANTSGTPLENFVASLDVGNLLCRCLLTGSPPGCNLASEPVFPVSSGRCQCLGFYILH